MVHKLWHKYTSFNAHNEHGIDGNENLLGGELLTIVGAMRSRMSVELIPIGLRTNTLTVSCSSYNLFIFGLTAWPGYSGLVLW